MPGIKDVAERAGLSIATVSRALAGKSNVSARSRLLANTAAQELGFVPSYQASSLASGRTRNIGLIVPSVDRWYFSSITEGVSTALLDAGYDVTLYNAGYDSDRRASVLSDFLLRKRIDAAIAVTLVLSDDQLHQLRSVKRPLVCIGGPLAGSRSIQIDDARIAAQAVEHLIGLGHTRIAHMTAAPDLDQDFRLPAQRHQAFAHTMAAAGLEVNPGWVVPADFTIQGGYSAARQLLGHGKRPTAVFAASDEMAIGTILAARDYGLQVPRDLSVIGIDGHQLGEVFGLTTIAQDPRAQGTLAAGLVLHQLEPEAFPAPPLPRGLAAAPESSPNTTERPATPGATISYPTTFTLRTSTAVPQQTG